MCVALVRLSRRLPRLDVTNRIVFVCIQRKFVKVKKELVCVCLLDSIVASKVHCFTIETNTATMGVVGQRENGVGVKEIVIIIIYESRVSVEDM